MEESPTGSPKREEQVAAEPTADTTAAEAVIPAPAADTAPATPVSTGKPARRNWTLIALVAVSIVAVLLLASTITLAVVGDFGGHGKPGAPAQIGNQPMGPMQQGPGMGSQQRRPGMPGNPGQKQQDQGEQDQNDQSELPQPSPPGTQSR